MFYQIPLEMTHMSLFTGIRTVHVIILTYSSSCISTEDVGCLTSSLKTQFLTLLYRCTDFIDKHYCGCCLTKFHFHYFIYMFDRQ